MIFVYFIWILLITSFLGWRWSLSLPALRRGCEKASRMGQGCVFQGRKTRGVATNVYSRKTSEKPKMEKVKGLRILKMRVRESFRHGESISTPRAHHKGRQPLIECANHDFKIVYFPFYMFFVYFPFLCFFFIFWPFYAFYFFVVDKGFSLASTYSSIAMRKSDLRSSLRIER